ncbi:hypothetical protein DFH07DRAFT_970400 [Mycena maculata]|uniref:Uncharacterized protein n=1 Tax=Mycena maculata TaxID=230809 RepID=A0AAD7HRJ6_9AGAR|nr:hypothetical protein DFH07DRAFT_970400 [Mycena maculata]
MRNRLDLPVELEREIFEIAAKADIGTALRLAVVARRVQAWVEPIIYSQVVVAHAPDASQFQIQNTRTILAHRIRAQLHNSKNKKKDPLAHVPRFIRTIPLRSASFFARNVRRLYVGHLSEPELVTVLSACTGVAELGWCACTLSPPVAAALSALPLRRLAVDHTFAFDALPPAPLARLTHLDLAFHEVSYLPLLPPLQHLRALTHFSAAFGRAVPPPSWAAPVFDACPALRIVLFYSDQMYMEQISGLRPRHPDPRVVVMLPPVGDWTARWVHDAWPLAEEVVRERRTIAAAEKAAAALDL